MSLQKNNHAIEIWEKNRHKIFSSKGGWRVGEAIYSHGYSLMDDLVGKVSYFQVYLMNVLGYLPEKRIADWVEAVHVCMSWPDPRIWCNQIGALAGMTQASVVGATVSGVLAADSTMYGSRPLLDGVEFIQNALKKINSGLSVIEIVDHEVRKHKGKVLITGYARPLATGDERVIAMEYVTTSLGFNVGEHLKLAYAIQDELRDRFNETMNINGYVSAFLSDCGWMPEQIYAVFSMCVMSGVTACYIEESTKPANTFLALRCEDIAYEGKDTRPVPNE